jgi:hypothetical protein
MTPELAHGKTDADFEPPHRQRCHRTNSSRKPRADHIFFNRNRSGIFANPVRIRQASIRN